MTQPLSPCSRASTPQLEKAREPQQGLRAFKKNSDWTECWKERRWIGSLIHHSGVCKMVPSLWKTIWHHLVSLNFNPKILKRNSYMRPWRHTQERSHQTCLYSKNVETIQALGPKVRRMGTWAVINLHSGIILLSCTWVNMSQKGES